MTLLWIITNLFTTVSNSPFAPILATDTVDPKKAAVSVLIAPMKAKRRNTAGMQPPVCMIRKENEIMKKFDNIFEQAREIIRQPVDTARPAPGSPVHRQARSGPPADRRRPAPPHLRPPRLPAQRLTRNRMPWQGRTGQSGPAPPPSIPPGISRNTKRGLHHDHPQRCPGLLPHAGQSGL